MHLSNSSPRSTSYPDQREKHVPGVQLLESIYPTQPAGIDADYPDHGVVERVENAFHHADPLIFCRFLLVRYKFFIACGKHV